MARRIAGGKTPAVEVLAEALAISQARAQAWLDNTPVGQDPDALTAQLLALAAPALKKEPQ
jgi:hypothetical protein